MPAIYDVSCDCKMFESTLYLPLRPTEKLPFGSLLYVQSDLSFRVLSRWSTDRHVACTRPQPCNISHCSPLNRPQYAHYGKPLKITRRKSFELIAAMKSCGKRQENRLYYLKSSDKVKSKWQFGGRLRILFESIWLAENHSCCLYNYRGLQ